MSIGIDIGTSCCKIYKFGQDNFSEKFPTYLKYKKEVNQIKFEEIGENAEKWFKGLEKGINENFIYSDSKKVFLDGGSLGGGGGLYLALHNPNKFASGKFSFILFFACC